MDPLPGWRSGGFVGTMEDRRRCGRWGRVARSRSGWERIGMGPARDIHYIHVKIIILASSHLQEGEEGETKEENKNHPCESSFLFLLLA